MCSNNEFVLDESFEDYFEETSNGDIENGEDEETQNDIETVSVEEFLIGQIMVKPPLWDSRLPIKDRSKTIRDNLWMEIYQAFGEQEEYSIAVLMKKLRNLRDTYVRVKGEMESYVPSGSGAGKKKKKKWDFYDLMSFLSDTVKYRPTVTNLQTSANSSRNIEKSPAVEALDSTNTLPSPSFANSNATPDKNKKVELAIIDALNRVNVPVTVPSIATHSSIHPVCITISELLMKMPLKERTAMEIQLLSKIYEGAKDFL